MKPDMTPDKRYLALGTEIPPPIIVPDDLSFVLIRSAGSFLYLAGHGPNRLKKPPEFDYVGKVGKELDRKQGYAAARLVGLNLLTTLRGTIGSLDRVRQVIHLAGTVNCTPDFTDHSYVLNGCSDLFLQIFDEVGKPTRKVWGAVSLAFNMAVEADMIVELI
jgi:enamine deaminase RidA (YjgF/YER057c/UK114 family)